ncbi:potassium-transporting ATPase subunit KdpC [Hydrogenovibrio sp. 3SP14C1]|uniref:potassium-transporting ATPase subunit KdpC n=1 Tax=Hydrogenovibrio sp. 3SP14C1 TaxID=3038774 RepID=UPI002415FC95|nr:potassium-transporting ATPase subunit KdpC [Hydrogenovibrio sp. 3SP14C1]MDG4813261.1 potassium-transporting ATPase subunit KdpC [Hydrogenovibrio sp. 3SP14C1]
MQQMTYESKTETYVKPFQGVLVIMALCGLLYPGIAVLLNQTLFPSQATGSLIYVGGKAVGSKPVGQHFSSPAYFHSRPSAADYQPFNLGGSNLAPSNPELQALVAERAKALLDQTTAQKGEIPVDMLTASGSGLDPHISPLAAEIQISRVATSRNLTKAVVQELVGQYTQQPLFNVLGQPRVHVLALNMALDTLSEQVQP